MAAFSKDLRASILRALEKDSRSLKVAAQFGVSASFVRKLRLQVQKEGHFDAKHGGGRSRLIKPKLEREVRKLVKEKPDATLNEMRRKLKTRTGVGVSETTMWRTLKRLGLTRKRKTVEASERKRKDVQAKRAEFKIFARACLPERLVSIDETGMNLAMTRAYGWAEIGERVHDDVPFRWENVTLIAALTTEGIEAPFLFPQAMDTQALRTYVEHVLVPSLRKHDIVLWDNLKVHDDPVVAEMIRRAGAKLVFLPPYSPDLNPIEKAWSMLKERLRQLAERTWDGLVASVGETLELVTPDHALAWYGHCGYPV